MIIYFDENIPKHLADGFQILQKPEGFRNGFPIEVRYIPTYFGRGAKDEDWIPEIGKQKACVITRDLNINRRKHEVALYSENKVGIFFIKGVSKKAGLSVWQTVEILAKHWGEIAKAVHEDKKPFAYEVTYRKIKRLDIPQKK